MGVKERIFLDASVLLTAVHDEFSDSGILLRRCRDGTFAGVISDTVLGECQRKLARHPSMGKCFTDLVGSLCMVEVSEHDLNRYAGITDLNDRHVLHGAVVAHADYIATLDWKHFLSPSAKARLKDYPIPRVFPGVLVSPFRYQQLPRLLIEVTRGTLSVGVDPDWTSQAVAKADRPFFLLDLEGVFRLWYDPLRIRVRMLAEVYQEPRGISFPRQVVEADGFLCIVTWDIVKGFSFMLDGVLRQIPGHWHHLPLRSKLWIGSDRYGTNQANAILCFHGWPRALTEREMRRVFSGGYVLLPERPASL